MEIKCGSSSKTSTLAVLITSSEEKKVKYFTMPLEHYITYMKCTAWNLIMSQARGTAVANPNMYFCELDRSLST